MSAIVKVADVLENYQPGDTCSFGDDSDWGWDDEFAQLWSLEARQMGELVDSIHRDGIRKPILLGNDGRLWDGHHRLAIAVALMHEEIRADYAKEVKS